MALVLGGPTREALPRGGPAAAGHREQGPGLSLPTRPQLAPAPSPVFFSPIFEDKCAESLAPTLVLYREHLVTVGRPIQGCAMSEQPRLPLARWPPGASRHGPASLTGPAPQSLGPGHLPVLQDRPVARKVSACLSATSDPGDLGQVSISGPDSVSPPPRGCGEDGITDRKVGPAPECTTTGHAG